MPEPNKKHADLIAKLLTVLVRRLDDSEYQILSQGAGLGIERVSLTYRLPDLMVFRAEALRRDSAETAETTHRSGAGGLVPRSQITSTDFVPLRIQGATALAGNGERFGSSASTRPIQLPRFVHHARERISGNRT